ncbi:MAG TPA: iron-containing alcohol dehydrogenase [Candidatus Dormibacteraeota bacterium]|nr:iron-containing alcohol dehydrogenase [Candidatus Dormibacteraeota bacterium]
MPTFTYSNPSLIHWGAGSAEKLRELEGKTVVVVTTRSLRGSVDRLPIRPACTVVIGQHAPQADIDEAVRLIDGRADWVVSFGGGSPIDAAKIISLRLDAVPHTAVPTTLSVAELGVGAGFTNEHGDKAGVRNPRLRVTSVIYDAELTVMTPMELWLSTGIRALDHAVEGFLAEGEHPFNDVMALESIRRLFDSLPKAKASPRDVSVRTANQLAAWFSFTLPAESAGGLSHTMGKQIGARHGIPHGVTSCLLLPHVMRYLATRIPERTALLPSADDVYGFIGSLGLPQHIAAFGIAEPELRRAAQELAGKFSAEDLLKIYVAAL